MSEEIAKRVETLSAALLRLKPSQMRWLESVVATLQKPATFTRLEESDLVTPCVLEDFGDALRIHHCFSAEPFSKDKFEYALERVLNLCGTSAQRVSSRTNPGHDMTIGSLRVSLKTQADKGLKRERIHISKFMELGKGMWTNREEEYAYLRDRFFEHLSRYDRIFSLRRLAGSQAQSTWEYELVEIPKSLLMEARDGDLDIKAGSKQSGAMPAYYRVREPQAEYAVEKFCLYFDGGGERKLQVKNIDKRYCQVHATWRFEVAV